MEYQFPPVDVPLRITAVFELLGSLALFVLPILSMGLYAEEARYFELLPPVTNWAVAVGKLLGADVFTTMLRLAYEATFAASPPVQPAVPLLGHLGLILLAVGVVFGDVHPPSQTVQFWLLSLRLLILIFFCG